MTDLAAEHGVELDFSLVGDKQWNQASADTFLDPGGLNLTAEPLKEVYREIASPQEESSSLDHQPSADVIALAQHLVQSGTLVACGVGPAGTGKTRDVVCRAIARDNRQRSATDIRTEAEQYATSRERLEKLYRYGLDMDTADFIDRQLDGWWDALDADAADTLTDEGRQKVRAAWRAVLARGVDPRDLMPTAVFNLGGVEEAGAVIAWRLRNEVDLTGARPDDVGLRPPVTRGADRELIDWLDETRQRLVDWTRDVTEPATEDGLDELTVEVERLRGELADAQDRYNDLDQAHSTAKGHLYDAQRSASERSGLARLRSKAHDEEKIAHYQRAVDHAEADLTEAKGQRDDARRAFERALQERQDYAARLDEQRRQEERVERTPDAVADADPLARLAAQQANKQGRDNAGTDAHVPESAHTPQQEDTPEL